MGKNSRRKIIGNSPCMTDLMDLVGIVAPKDVKTLIRVETGTGKELMPEAVHSRGDRKGMPFIRVNCAALTRDLLPAELFGHVKGSFTGATDSRTGLIAAADRGTLFLDEIDDLSCNAQGALLRFLQEGEVKPIGSHHTMRADVRVISATNRELKTAKKGRFHNDPYHLLNGFPLVVPPLRERREDIPHLVAYFVKRYGRKYKERVTGFTPKAMARFQAHPWDGNVRELRNVVRSAVILARGRRRLSAKDIGMAGSGRGAPA